MTIKKERLAERLAKLLNDGTDAKELEKLSVQKLHYEIQRLEEPEQEPEVDPESEPEVDPPPPPPQKEKKEKSLWSILVLDDSSSEDEE